MKPNPFFDELEPVKPMSGPLGKLFYMDIRYYPEDKAVEILSTIEMMIKNIVRKHCYHEKFYTFNTETGEIEGLKYNPQFVCQDYYLTTRDDGDVRRKNIM